MTRSDKSILLSFAIGDGSLQKITGSQKGRLFISHGEKQLQYLEHKKEVLKSILHKNVTIYSTKSKFGVSYRLAVGHKYFRILRNLLYSNNRKTLSINVLNRLNPIGLAYWYMDDGSLYPKKRNGKIHAYELVISVYGTKEECESIIQWFKDTYNIDCGLKLNKGRYSIRMGTKNAKKFADIVSPHILDMFKYKIDFNDK